MFRLSKGLLAINATRLHSRCAFSPISPPSIGFFRAGCSNVTRSMPFGQSRCYAERSKRAQSRARGARSQPKRGKSARGISIQETKRSERIKSSIELMQKKIENIKETDPNSPGRRYALAQVMKSRYSELKKRKVSGIGHTPARFQLYPIENEAKTEILSVLQRDKHGKVKKSLKMSEVRDLLKSAEFEDLKLNPEIISAAKALITETCSTRRNTFTLTPAAQSAIENPKPTPIQTLAIPELLRFRTANRKEFQIDAALLAAETGSGKTLAYLLPLIHLLKQDELDLIELLKLAKAKTKSEQDALDRPFSEINWAKLLFKERRPRAVIIVPTQELAEQTLQTCKKLCHSIKFNATIIDRTKGLKKIVKKTENSILDLVIGTPATLRKCFHQGAILSLANTRYVVIDEADTIMDDQGHLDDTLMLLKQVRYSNSSVDQNRFEKVIFVSATLPKTVVERVHSLYPNLINISTPNLHQVNPKLIIRNIDVPKEFHGIKMEALTQVLRESTRDKRTLIFCNDVKSCLELYSRLAYLKFPVLLLTGNLKNTSKPTKYRELVARASNQGYTQDHDDNDDNDDNDANDNDMKNNNDNDDDNNFDIEAKASISTAGKYKKKYVLYDLNQIDTMQLRKDALKIFNSDEPIPFYSKLEAPRSTSKHFNTPELTMASASKILISSDLGSRGLDTMNVDHVIMYDYPTTAINYIHRSGRAGRVVNRGKITTLIGTKDRKNAQKVGLFLKSGVVVG